MQSQGTCSRGPTLAIYHRDENDTVRGFSVIQQSCEGHIENEEEIKVEIYLKPQMQALTFRLLLRTPSPHENSKRASNAVFSTGSSPFRARCACHLRRYPTRRAHTHGPHREPWRGASRVFPVSSHLVGMLTLRWTLQVSTHVHDVFGGSGFAETYDYNRAVNSQCTTITIPQDKSNYWVVGDTDHDNQSCMTLTEPTARCILRQP